MVLLELIICISCLSVTWECYHSHSEWVFSVKLTWNSHKCGLVTSDVDRLSKKTSCHIPKINVLPKWESNTRIYFLPKICKGVIRIYFIPAVDLGGFWTNIDYCNNNSVLFPQMEGSRVVDFIICHSISNRIPRQPRSWETTYILFFTIFVGKNTHQGDNSTESYLLFTWQFCLPTNCIKLQNRAPKPGIQSWVTWKVLSAHHHEL